VKLFRTSFLRGGRALGRGFSKGWECVRCVVSSFETLASHSSSGGGQYSFTGFFAGTTRYAHGAGFFEQWANWLCRRRRMILGPHRDIGPARGHAFGLIRSFRAGDQRAAVLSMPALPGGATKGEHGCRVIRPRVRPPIERCQPLAEAASEARIARNWRSDAGRIDKSRAHLGGSGDGRDRAPPS